MSWIYRKGCIISAVYREASVAASPLPSHCRLAASSASAPCMVDICVSSGALSPVPCHTVRIAASRSYVYCADTSRCVQNDFAIPAMVHVLQSVRLIGREQASRDGLTA